MNLRIEIQKEHCKSNTIKVANLIGSDSELFSNLMDLYFNKKDIDTARKSAWVLRECVENYPFLLDPYISKVIRYLRRKNLHDAIKRNGLAILEKRKLNEKDEGLLLDISFDLIKSGNEPTAVKAFAMEIIDNISKSYPEVRSELRIILEDQIPYGSVGFKNKAIKIINSMI